MGYVENSLMSGEEIIFKTSLNLVHLMTLPGAFFVWGILMLVNSNPMGVFFMLLGIAFAIGRFFDFKSSEFAVTNKRVLLKSGAFRRTTVELLLSKIEGLNMDQGLFDRILGSGTIMVTGTGGKPVVFKKIDKPTLLRKHVNEQIDAKVSAGQPKPAAG